MHEHLLPIRLTILVVLGSSALRAAAPPWEDAVAVWHMADSKDSAGEDSRLEASGDPKLGVELDAEERAASRVRGGDGLAADLHGGHLDAGQGAGGELNLRGRALSVYVRLRNPSGDWRTHGILSKHGGHDWLVYNLYANGGDLGFELGTDEGLHRVRVPAAAVGATGWHDGIARFDGRLLELFVGGRSSSATARSCARTTSASTARRPEPCGRSCSRTIRTGLSTTSPRPRTG